MTNRLIGIYNGLTDTYIEREATDEEQAEIDAKEVAAAIKDAEEISKEAELRAIKINAYTKLGLTAEEIEALLPTPKPPRQSD